MSAANPTPQIEAEVARLDERRNASADAFHWTDVGNAERLIARHGNDLLYVDSLRQWRVWDRQRWCADDTGEVVRRMQETARAMLLDAVSRDDKAFRSHALASEREPRIRAAITLAQSRCPARPDQFDADPWALNVANGTVDLRTGKLRLHDPADLLTKLAPVDYDPAVDCPRWLAFLDLIFGGNAEVIEHVRRLVGVSVAGTTGVQKLLLGYGGGSNGKSTFGVLLQRLLGEYAHQAPSELLMLRDRNRGGATPDLADLQGRRLVFTIETSEGRRLDEALVKQLTGGDAITARRLYAQPFTFRPTHTIMLLSNHLPEFRGADHAIRRRLELIPFSVTIPPADQRDQDDVVSEFLEEGPGIIAWAVQGCLAWQREGLGSPESVRAATDDYLAEMDVLAGFLADICVSAPSARAKKGDLYAAYVAWCVENHEHVIPQRGFGMRLRDRGYTETRTGKARWWVGVGLLADSSLFDSPPEAEDDA